MQQEIDVFIAYRRTDRAAVDAIAQKLQASGYVVVTDSDIADNLVYQDALDAIIRAARMTLVLWTPQATLSEHVVWEARLARDLEKAGRPNLYQGVLAGVDALDIPGDLKNHQMLDLALSLLAPESLAQIEEKVSARLVKQSSLTQTANQESSIRQRQFEEWLKVSSSDEPSIIGEYIKQNTDSPFAEAARNRLIRIDKEPSPRLEKSSYWATILAAAVAVMALGFSWLQFGLDENEATVGAEARLSEEPTIIGDDNPESSDSTIVEERTEEGTPTEVTPQEYTRLSADLSPIVRQCDLLAGYESDIYRNPNVPTVLWDNVDGARAAEVCRNAITAFPEIPRLRFQEARGQYRLAVTDDDLDLARQALKTTDEMCEAGYLTGCLYSGNARDSDSYHFDDLLDLPSARAYFSAACERDLAVGCAEFGDHLLETRDTNALEPIAYEHMLMACTAEIGWACGQAGVVKRDGLIGNVDFEDAVAHFEDGCRLADGWSCQQAGHLLKDQDKNINDDALSLSYFERGCENNDSNACANIGWMHLWRDVPNQSNTAAITRLKEGCENGQDWACGHYGETFERGLAGAPNYELALKNYAKGCAADDAWSCRQAGQLLDDRDKPTHNDAEALDYYERGCALNHASSCASIGWAHLWRDVPNKSNETAVARLKEGCEAGENWACGHYGYTLERGLLGNSDLDLALHNYARACESGHNWSCRQQAGLLLDEDYDGNDLNEAKSILNRSCDGEDWQACEDLGRTLEMTASSNAEQDEAAAKYELACRNGEHSSCRMLGWMTNLEEAGAERINTLREILPPACAAGEAESCFILAGIQFQDGNIASATDLLEQSCSEDTPYHCEVFFGFGVGIGNEHTSPEELAEAYVLALQSAYVIDWIAYLPDQEPRQMTRSEIRPILTEIQRTLKDEGHYSGALDGVFGPGTRRAFQSVCPDCDVSRL